MMCRWQFQVAIGDSAPKLFRFSTSRKTRDQFVTKPTPACLLIWRWAPAGMMAPAALASGEARAEPVRFFRFSPAYANTEGAALAEIITRNGTAAASDSQAGR